MVRRTLRIGLEVVGILIAGLVILAGFGAYRLSEGHPFHLAFLVPYIERSLVPPGSDVRVQLDDLVIAWTGGQKLVGLRATAVRAVAKDGRVIASVPQIGLTLSLRALLRGLVAPTEVEIFNPGVHMRRNQDGHFEFLTLASDQMQEQSADFIPKILASLTGPPNLNNAAGYLRSAKLIGGTLDFDDRRTGVIWHAPRIDIELRRDRQGMVGQFSAQVRELGDPASLDAQFVFDRSNGDLAVNSKFNGVDIAALGLIVPDLAALSASHFEFNGTVGTLINIDGTIGAVHFTLGGGPGTIDLPGRFPAPIPVSSLALAGEMESGFDSLRLDALTLDLGGPRISAKARVTGLASYRVGKIGRIRVSGEAKALEVPVSSLPNLWPLSGEHTDNARRWVIENIDEGTVKNAEVQFDIAFAGGDLDNPQVFAFGGTMTANGVGLNYLRPLPKIRGAAGTATFDASEFAVDFTAGGVGNLLIQRGHLSITGLDQFDQFIAVEGDIDGPLREALQLLDHPRLGYMRKMGLDPASSEGSTSVHLTLKFPASKDLTFEQVHLAAHARIEQAKIAGIFLHRDMTEGNFELELDNLGMQALGRAKLAGIPASLRWDSQFNAREFRNRISLAADTTAAELARLGFDYHQVLEGPLGLKLLYTEPISGLKQVAIDFDLTRTSATLDVAKWHKAPGVEASAALHMTLDGDRPVAITEFSFDGGGFSGSGQGRFDGKGELDQVGFRHITLDKSRLSDVVVDFIGERVDVRVGGGEIDAERFASIKGSSTPTQPPPEQERTRPFTLAADHLDRVILGPGREIGGVRLAAAYDGLHWERLEAEGTPSQGKPMTLHWLPAADGTHKLDLVAEDAGSTLKVLGIFDDVVGGRLTITGTASDADAKRSIKGHVSVSEYRLVNQSALMRLLTIATLTGIADAMTGEGFQMYRFEGDFTKTGGHVEVPLARTWGPSLGLTATGSFDYDTNQIDVTGTIAPAYALSSLIGQIPLLGFLLTGGEGKGVFAAVYTAKGKLSEPTFSVNALSALAPGFLRGMFGLFEGGAPGEASTALPPNFGKTGTSK